MEANTALIPYVQKFFEYDPLTATHALETMDEDEAVQILIALPVPVCVGIFHKLQIEQAADYLEKFLQKNLYKLLKKLSLTGVLQYL